MCAEDAGNGSGGWLCRGCFAGHGRGMLPGHQATTPETRSEREVLLAEFGIEPPPTVCGRHARRGGGSGQFTFFCPDDGEPLCALCVLDHRAHGYLALPVVAAACRSHLASLVDGHGTWPSELAPLALPPPEDPATGAPPTPEGAARLQRREEQQQRAAAAAIVPWSGGGASAGAREEAVIESGIEAAIAELQVGVEGWRAGGFRGRCFSPARALAAAGGGGGCEVGIRSSRGVGARCLRLTRARRSGAVRGAPRRHRRRHARQARGAGGRGAAGA